MENSAERHKHAVVTGAASGIGAAVVADLHGRGWRITAVDMRDDLLDATLSKLGDSAPEPWRVITDLSNPEAPSDAVREAWEHAPVDALVNCAGIYPAIPFWELTPELWDRTQAVNVRAAVFGTIALAKLAVLEGRAPSVVNITSGAAYRARPGAAHYSTSKAALTMATRACAVELGASGIRVNAVSPGFVEVNSAINPVTDEYAAAVSANPLGRVGVPGDLLGAIRFLLSDEASWMTGSIVDVDGGSHAGTTALPVHWPGLTEVQRAQG